MRGRTREGRLRGFDAWLLAERAQLLREAQRVFDVGLGDSADTTAELGEALLAAESRARLIGVDVEAARVDAAKRGFPGLEFQHQPPGTVPAEKAGLIRLLNVLRGYREEDAAAELARWKGVLEPGGLLLEGSCDPHGAVGCAQLVSERDELLFLTDFSKGFAPWQLRDWLPRHLRRAVKPGTEVFSFFEAWTAAWKAEGAQGFAAAAQSLGLKHGALSTGHSWMLKPAP